MFIPVLGVYKHLTTIITGMRILESGTHEMLCQAFTEVDFSYFLHVCLCNLSTWLHVFQVPPALTQDV